MLQLNSPEGALSELLYADDIILKSETIEGLMYKFLKRKEAFESKSLNVSHGKTKLNQTKRWHYKVDPLGVSSLTVKAQSSVYNVVSGSTIIVPR